MVGVQHLFCTQVFLIGLDAVVSVELLVPFNGFFIQDPVGVCANLFKKSLAAPFVAGFDPRLIGKQGFGLFDQSFPVCSVFPALFSE